eukprot:Gb_25289 [translate_table: standard]
MPNFKGSVKTEDLLDWFGAMEKILRLGRNRRSQEGKIYKHSTQRPCGHMVGTHAKGESQEDKEKIRMWTKMVRKLKGKFLTTDYGQRLFREF